MRIQLVFFNLGKILLIIGAAMLLPLLIAFIYRENNIMPFLASTPITLGAGLIMMLICRKAREQVMRQREGYLFVTMVWILAAIFGALPFYLGGFQPQFAAAVFETMSGFTTTGASAFNNVEVLPHSIIFWRALTHWLGGAGIVMLFVAIMRSKDNSGSGAVIFNAEHSGADLTDKITPKISDAAKALCIVYLAISAILTALLMLGGMNFFDALIHSFATVSTGGFSNRNASVAHYDSAYIEWVIIIFMLLSSINMALYYLWVAKRKNNLFQDEEARIFLFIIIGAALLISIDLYQLAEFSEQGFEYTLRKAMFQVATVVTTTGFATANYDLWPTFSRVFLFVLMFCGGCIGSTSSAIKVSRLIVAFRACRNELLGMVHPRMVKKLYFNKRLISQNTVNHILIFIGSFLFFTAVGSVLLAANGMPFTEALSASLACIANVGPGLGAVGPAGNYFGLDNFSYYILVFNMLFGRLELLTVLVLFLPGVWRK